MGLDRASVRCAAKVNLALKILHRREDGFHELDTVFQSIDLWDRVDARSDTELSVECDLPGVPVGPTNLAYRAADRLRELSGCRSGAVLTLRKQIPAQAGLGGGSSDAAAALVLCRRLWGLDTTDDELAQIAGELGSDVPFFLTGGTARGAGRGERIEALPALRETALLLGFPPFGVPTAGVYRGVADRLTLPGFGVSLPPLFAHKWPEGNDFSFVVNDLERIVFPEWPELERFRDALVEHGASRALLSGSGSTVFGIYPDGEQRDGAIRSLRGRFPMWRVANSRTVPTAIERLE